MDELTPPEVVDQSRLVPRRCISDQRGAQTYFALDGRGAAVALKVTRKKMPRGEANAGASAEEIVRNEIRAHLKIPVLATYLTHSHGETERYLWLASRWIEGPTATAEAGRIAESGFERPVRIGLLIRLFIDMASALSPIFDSGFVHGDLQGAHFIVDTAGGTMRLIDFGGARIGGEVCSIPETGLVYFTAPEVADRALKEDAGPPALDQCAEMFSLGAVWNFLHTGRTLLQDPDGKKDYRAMLTDAAHGVFTRFSARDGFEHEELSLLIGEMISVRRERRPTLGSCLERLRHMLRESS